MRMSACREMMDSMSGPIYQLSVLANGNILLNGKPSAIADVAAALASCPRESVVWYYRENAAAEPPGIALEVLKIVTDRRLPVRLFTKPDFSDVEPPRAAAEFARVFESARKRAALSQLVVVRPDGRLLSFPALLSLLRVRMSLWDCHWDRPAQGEYGRALVGSGCDQRGYDSLAGIFWAGALRSLEPAQSIKLLEDRQSSTRDQKSRLPSRA